jgi:hypothetical protein
MRRPSLGREKAMSPDDQVIPIRSDVMGQPSASHTSLTEEANPSNASADASESETKRAPAQEPAQAQAPDAADSPFSVGKDFETAVSEAEQIVLYTARHGIEVPDDILKTVVDANARRSELLSVDDRVKFWKSAQVLAKLVQPVTPYSIRATYTGSARATILWSIFSVFLLALLITTQIVWVAGMTHTKNFEDASKNLQATETKLLASKL